MTSESRKLTKLSHSFFSSINNHAGVYLITSKSYYENAQKTNQDKILVKVGIGTNLEHRLNSYLLYWPEGIVVWGIIFTKTKKKALEVEKVIHGYLNAKGKYIVTGHSKDEEWFMLSEPELKVLFNVVKANKDTRYPKSWNPRELRGRRVFGYEEVSPISKMFLIANREVGSHRVKAIGKELKGLLDRQYKEQNKKKNKPKPNLLLTEQKPKKKTRKDFSVTKNLLVDFEKDEKESEVKKKRNCNKSKKNSKKSKK